jgi:hypothetical protein
MGRREDDNDPRTQEIAPEQIVDAVAREDGREVERITAELARHEDASILAIEHDTERAARAHRDPERIVDRVRNLFQAILLNRLLHRRRPPEPRL